MFRIEHLLVVFYFRDDFRLDKKKNAQISFLNVDLAIVLNGDYSVSTGKFYFQRRSSHVSTTNF
ncbi:hypothetical protein U14_03065 [Candidatus Moduliflexus flocculans]|uniref:Uncharacterized protein n=1 Tax=Candidatus Moduliflexus flocculans TaxID=1499966 RepID=A0A081BN53_9BACT|nr:hypothetical protein U14_03065 [Candidatus Moduliflexus flocculans]